MLKESDLILGETINEKILSKQRTSYQCQDLCGIRTVSTFLIL